MVETSQPMAAARRAVRRLLALVGITALLLGWRASAQAEDDASTGLHRQELGFAAGYGHGTDWFGSGTFDGKDVRTLVMYPYWQIALSGPLAVDSWAHGRFHFRIEGIFIVNFAPDTGRALGVGGLFRYAFRPRERIQPFAEIGAGLVDLEYGLQDQSDGFNFVLQGGGGLRFWLPTRRPSALDFFLRFHHISNAQLRRPNRAVESFQFGVGYVFPLD